MTERMTAEHARKPLPRRFYQTVTVAEETDGLHVRLDGRPLRTPLKAPLCLPSQALARAVADEWAVQHERIDPASMPMTRLSNTAIDRVAPDPARIVDEILAYAASDLLCYRADEPEGLVARQAQHWDPPLAWAARTLGARLVAVAGITHHEQPAASLAAVRANLAGQDAFRLTSLHNMTTLSGSAVIALALAGGCLDADAAWAAAHVDEDWQAEQWGRDALAEHRRAARRAEFDAAVRLLALVS